MIVNIKTRQYFIILRHGLIFCVGNVNINKVIIMKILYRQKSIVSGNNAWMADNIENCYLKEIIHIKDYKKQTPKMHYHTEYEIHMVVCGTQVYEINDTIFEIKRNEFIIIPTRVKHRVVFSSPNLSKYSMIFNSDAMKISSVFCGELSETVQENIRFILEEYKKKTETSYMLIENRVAEILILFFRSFGCENKRIDAENFSNDDRLELAKKFIIDNIEQNVSVTDVAAYCHLSTRQISRIFLDAEGISPAKYINNEKFKKISEYLINTDLSMQRISEIFSYNNEYYFNTAFKKHFGMPPLTYRKMFR